MLVPEGRKEESIMILVNSAETISRSKLGVRQQKT